ncbi:hypothetical protein GJ744_007521 [Endocarpon pusillum]|uniref:Uncharacterized protein n=1 Tax=Endocarpon pusillum TaxID=364733 RepID=A0A8H7A654_9EURO|nr:hypothetical protein GJ744_007521 [Endocarpon pusillum]
MREDRVGRRHFANVFSEDKLAVRFALQEALLHGKPWNKEKLLWDTRAEGDEDILHGRIESLVTNRLWIGYV